MAKKAKKMFDGGMTAMPARSNFGGAMRGMDRAAMMSGRNFRNAPATPSPIANPATTPAAPLPYNAVGSTGPAQDPFASFTPMQQTGTQFGAITGDASQLGQAQFKKGGRVKYSVDGIAQRGKTRAKLKGK